MEVLAVEGRKTGMWNVGISRIAKLGEVVIPNEIRSGGFAGPPLEITPKMDVI